MLSEVKIISLRVADTSHASIRKYNDQNTCCLE